MLLVTLHAQKLKYVIFFYLQSSFMSCCFFALIDGWTIGFYISD